MEMFWEKPDWEHEDRHLKQLKQQPFRRPFPFSPKNPGLYLIRGPRQVGKSSFLKHILSEWVKKEGADTAFFLSCEMLKDHQELGQVLESVKHKKMILLDEVTFVEHWDRAVKYFLDRGYSFYLIASGSNASDLRRGADTFPGRFGGGGETVLRPMGFDEFHRVRQEAGWALPTRKAELEAYFLIGGFPSAVLEAADKLQTPKNACENYWRWLVGDVRKLGKQEVYLREMLGQLALTMGSPISLQKLAQRTQMGSHHTAQEYVQLLEDCFALRTLYAIDLDLGSFRFRKEKKFYFTDPLLFWIALEVSGQNFVGDANSVIAEQVANEFLASSVKKLGYFHSPAGEVDFIDFPNRAIEVKWSPVARNLSKAFKTLPYINKKVWTQDNFLS